VSLGIAYAMSGEYQSALAEYQKAKAVDPTTENPHQRLGRDYYLDGALEEAATEFAQAIGEEPDEAAAFFYLMDCYNRLGRCDDALDIYEQIKQRFGRDPEETSGFYEYFQMHREAIAALEQLAERNPEDAEIRFRLSAAYHAAGRLEDAIKTAECGVDIDPGNAHALAHLGGFFFEHGEYHRAVTACRRAIRINPYDQGAHVTLADSLLFLGRDEEAQQTIEEMERSREESWRRYKDKFSGGDGNTEGEV
jgi:pentatricopeptide repeat protein